MPEMKKKSLVERLQALEREHHFLHRHATKIEADLAKRIVPGLGAAVAPIYEPPELAAARQLCFDLNITRKNITNLLRAARAGRFA